MLLVIRLGKKLGLRFGQNAAKRSCNKDLIHYIAQNPYRNECSDKGAFIHDRTLEALKGTLGEICLGPVFQQWVLKNRRVPDSAGAIGVPAKSQYASLDSSLDSYTE